MAEDAGVSNYVLSVRTRCGVVGDGPVRGFSVDQLRRGDVLHGQPERLEQRDLLGRLAARLRAGHDLSYLGEDLSGGDDVARLFLGRLARVDVHPRTIGHAVVELPPVGAG